MTNWSLLNPSDTLEINSAKFKVPRTLGIGYSFFLPALKGQAAFLAVRSHYRIFDYQLTWDERIEDEVLGIRVWRVA
jgi:hypothetical protein